MDTGRTVKQEAETKKTTYPPSSLEAQCGFTIRKASSGGGYIFSWIDTDEKGNEHLNPIDEVNDSKFWLGNRKNMVDRFRPS